MINQDDPKQLAEALRVASDYCDEFFAEDYWAFALMRAADMLDPPMNCYTHEGYMAYQRYREEVKR